MSSLSDASLRLQNVLAARAIDPDLDVAGAGFYCAAACQLMPSSSNVATAASDRATGKPIISPDVSGSSHWM
eukprot:CAMPEP_0179425232 /NCGR_PEP_ID=MMETSP0799-20121207/12057_1 /TAXON_ID=46947 /ORGANISM="Geminigera cryophila, Strain CCMP2564" /LENGTH=71 /DNA_ID=CAMNT_0021199827 /DNA_START=463 /DNA_END=679 /DNA_ORIENTATION=+